MGAQPGCFVGKSMISAVFIARCFQGRERPQGRSSIATMPLTIFVRSSKENLATSRFVQSVGLKRVNGNVGFTLRKFTTKWRSICQKGQRSQRLSLTGGLGKVDEHTIQTVQLVGSRQYQKVTTLDEG